MEGERGQDSVEGVGGVREGFFIRERGAGHGEQVVKGKRGIAVKKSGGRIGGCKMRETGRQGRTAIGGVRGKGGGESPGDVTGVGAEVEHVGKMAFDVLKGAGCLAGKMSGGGRHEGAR